jgi:glyoxylase-like metal-dependent hydrolase (beta-lactamase superfamily II)
VVLTHQHIDNLGLASVVAARSGAEVRRSTRLPHRRAPPNRPRPGPGALGHIAVTQASPTLSEVLGHIDLLVDQGRVREVEQGGVVFEALPGTSLGTVRDSSTRGAWPSR